MEAIKQVILACAKLPPQERDMYVAKFHNQVWYILLRHFAIESPIFLSDGCYVSHTDDDALLDAAAELLWAGHKKGRIE